MRGAILTTLAATTLCAAAVAQSNGTRPPALGLAGTATPRKAPMRTIETPYYVIHSDLSDAEIREADLRMTRMFEAYQRVTAGFTGAVKEKFPFFVFRNEEDYRANGGPPKSQGVYVRSSVVGKRLMTFVGGAADDTTWETVQHEGFHQFIDATIRADLPIWVNEGLAEYFGQGLFTGDGFTTGLIPNDRLNRVRRGIAGKFLPFKKLMALNDQTWIENLDEANYDEAWAMVHFLGHADNARYLPAFGQFMNQVAKGTDGQRAWENVFGKDIDGFQRQFAQWWMSLPDNPTQLQYTQALVLTETSFLARATLQRQKYPDANAFFHTFKPENMVPTRDMWLPPAMWEDYKQVIVDSAGWTLENGNSPRLSLTLADGTKILGAFALNNGKVGKVAVQVTAGKSGK